MEQDIFRDNMVFGDAGAGEYGTFYIAYANDPAITELMLQHMFVGKPPGNYDHILDVSTPVTGSLFFVPSLDLLETLADEEITQSPTDGSLRIGSLKGQAQSPNTRRPTAICIVGSPRFPTVHGSRSKKRRRAPSSAASPPAESSTSQVRSATPSRR